MPELLMGTLLLVIFVLYAVIPCLVTATILILTVIETLKKDRK